MNKLELLTEIYNKEVRELMSYSKNYLMKEPKEDLKEKWNCSKEKVKLLEEIIDDVRNKTKSKEQVINKILVKDKEQLDELYNSSAFTLIGLESSDESIKGLIDWIKEYSEVSNPLNVYITSGGTMNKEYNLSGENMYKNNLTIVSIKNQDIKQLMRIVVPRFEIGGRWFDDIVNNDLWREEEKQTTEESEGFE